MSELDVLNRNIRDILNRMHAIRVPIGGGSGRRERYEMRETILYFNLGREIISLMSAEGVREDQVSIFLARMGENMARLFDFNPNIVNWSVRFAKSFQDEEYFKEVSTLCSHSFGQIREVVDILGKENPLALSQEDIETFRDQLKLGLTYAEMQSVAAGLKQKYGGKEEDSQVDYNGILDNIADITRRADKLIQDGSIEDRKKFRELVGDSAIQTLRHTLILLARESELEKHQAVVRKIISQSSRPETVLDFSIGQLIATLSPFLKYQTKTRDRLRKYVGPADLTGLQKILKALESEEELRNYIRTSEIFKSLEI